MQNAELDDMIHESLESFYKEISGRWCGREREMVSLFAFGHLAKRCSSEKPLFSLAQIGIEVAVQQLARSEQHPRRGPTVCKDLVIWPDANMTLWDTDGKIKHEPLAVMEWKVNYFFGRRFHAKNRLEHRADVEWLKEKSEHVKDFSGYAVLVECTSEPKELICARIRGGIATSHWTVLPNSQTTND